MKGTTMADTIDAGADPKGASLALGLDDADEPDTGQDPEGDEPEGDEEEVTLESLAAQIAEQNRTIARLKREAAETRVKAKAESKGKAAGAEDGETVEQARERGKEEARLEYSIKLAEVSVRAALAGIIPEGDLDDFVGDLRLERYVTEDGEPDQDAIKSLRDRQAKITRRGTGRVSHGRQTGTTGSKSKGDQFADVLDAAGF